MYKIFFKDRVIILTKRIENDLSADFSSILKYANQGELQQFIQQFDNDESMKRAYIYHHNANELLQHFRDCFKNLPAAGGLVWNKDQTAFLGMKRLGYFDLPKGKMEASETMEEAAVREVEEECGISGLSISKKLPRTFHTYKIKDQSIFKETHWFEMVYHGDHTPQPQVEENIESVFWVRPHELPTHLANTYPSIIEVLKSAQII
ncbi:NUDIX domain-containing protein [Geofilum rubicundum]|uniref:Bis(5'-nucleosyl)-tetraphosphatase n=1 Tax=Geofilum rubicundum JCM 15548 TaxID=1236989 RepID=A0A0E9LUU8_9BACT|nr:NUDIX domain-containing protein [Geofilum rubicundum]GAO29024.1 bis(5'-nucleosyl)-tetraphosphatase [Geofilum rubicundum JCM 15548]